MRADRRESQIRFQEQMERIGLPLRSSAWFATLTLADRDHGSPLVMPALYRPMVATTS
jgi:hypothetical protein